VAQVTISKAKISKVLCASILFHFGACSSIVDNLGLEGLHPSRLSTTGIGAVAGGVLGAGAGLIVGSTSGDAGEGLLIGTGVGALAGAAVGYELESQEDQLAAHQATISRQQQEIQLQKQHDIIVTDVTSNFTPDSGIEVRKIAPVLPSSDKVAISQMNMAPVVTTPVVSEPIEVMPIKTIPVKTKTIKTKVAKVKPVVKPVIDFNKNKRSSDSPIRIAKTYSMDVEQKMSSAVRKETKFDVAKEIASHAPVAVMPTVAKTKQAVVSELAAKTVGGTCSDAASEVDRARNAASDTDKLFYYRRALRLCKDKPEYHVEIGRVYSSIGRREEAEFEFSRALEIDPEHRDAQDELTMLMLNNTY